MVRLPKKSGSNFMAGKRPRADVKELITMANKTSKTETKRLSKGQRTHVRRLKQAARKEANPNSSQSRTSQPFGVPKKQDQT
jgi:hypothetical protein